MASDAAWKRVRRKALLNRGFCPVCGENSLDRDGAMCSKCLVTENERKRNWARRRVKEGKCPYCGGNAILGKPYCAECKERIIEGNRERRQQQRKKVS